MDDFVPAWGNAIARFEGFFSPGSRPARDHNPGDLKFAGQAGASGHDSGGFAVFPDDATGFQALFNQLEKYVRDFPNYSLLQIMAHYLGQHAPEVDAEGNAFTYANAVAGELGVPVETTLAQLSAGPPMAGDGETIAGDGSPGASGAGSGSGNLIALAAAGGLFLWLATRLLGW